MMRLITAAVLLICLASHCSDSSPVPGHYHLPHQPGYIPVYIRHDSLSLHPSNAHFTDGFHENIELAQFTKAKDIKDINDSSSSEESEESNERYKIKVHHKKDKDNTSESDESSEEIIKEQRKKGDSDSSFSSISSSDKAKKKINRFVDNEKYKLVKKRSVNTNEHLHLQTE